MYVYSDSFSKYVFGKQCWFSSLTLVNFTQPSLNMSYIYNILVSVYKFEQFRWNLFANPKVFLNAVCVFEHKNYSLNIGHKLNYISFGALNGPQTSFFLFSDNPAIF